MLATFRIGGVVEWSTSKFGGPDEEWGFSGIWGSFLDPFDQVGTDFGFKPVVGLLGPRDPGGRSKRSWIIRDSGCSSALS